MARECRKFCCDKCITTQKGCIECMSARPKEHDCPDGLLKIYKCADFCEGKETNLYLAGQISGIRMPFGM